MLEFIRTFIEDRRDQWRDRNRRIKAAKISRVFKREGGLVGCSLSTKYAKVCDHPGRCATGALLAAAGVPDAELEKFGAPTTPFFNILREVYGLSTRESMSLLDANDGNTLADIWIKCNVGGLRPHTEVRVCVVKIALSRLVSVDRCRVLGVQQHQHESLGA